MHVKYRSSLLKLMERLTCRSEVLGVVLFGSLAKGEAKRYPESDIDLLVVANELPANPAERRLKLLPLKEGLGVFEDIWLTPEELTGAVRGGWGVVLDALDEGIILYDPKRILAEAKGEIHQRYRRLGRIWARPAA